MVIKRTFPANIYLIKTNSRNTSKRCEICSNLTLKHENDVSNVAPVFLWLTLIIFHIFFYCFYC